jgi:hypothetical protein
MNPYKRHISRFIGICQKFELHTKRTVIIIILKLQRVKRALLKILRKDPNTGLDKR